MLSNIQTISTLLVTNSEPFLRPFFLQCWAVRQLALVEKEAQNATRQLDSKTKVKLYMESWNCEHGETCGTLWFDF